MGRGALLMCALVVGCGGERLSTDSMNRIIGDRGVYAVLGERAESASEDDRIAAHLTHVERTLRARPGTPARDRQLARLRDYITRGEFPRNDDHPDARRPTFIDAAGHICAVGYLIEQELGRDAAEAIAAKYKYAFIDEIDDPALARWATDSGLSTRELAMIQPAYPSPSRRDHTPPFATADPIDSRSAFGAGVGLAMDDAEGTALRTELFGQRMWHRVGVYGQLGLAGGLDTETADSALHNAELGAVYVSEYLGFGRVLYRAGAILPTAGDAVDELALNQRVLTHRIGDTALLAGQNAGGRLSVSPMLVSAGTCYWLSWIGEPNTCYARLDLGVDVFHRADDEWHAIPRANAAIGARFPIAAIGLETAAIRAPETGDLLQTVAASLRFAWPWGDWDNFHPGIAYVLPIADGDAELGATLLVDLRIAWGERHDGW